MRLPFLLCVSALLASPLVFAHSDGNPYGMPKPYCENLKGDENVHDYTAGGGPPAILLLAFFLDGNQADCDGDGVPGDYDGHSEWAVGGAWLLSSDAGAPVSGATTCFGEAPHHGLLPDVWLFDHIWAARVIFIVGIDTTNFPITDPSTGITIDCGDNIDDIDTGYCADHCPVGFAPGTDGSYHVYVLGIEICDPNGIECFYIPPVVGHVYT